MIIKCNKSLLISLLIFSRKIQVLVEPQTEFEQNILNQLHKLIIKQKKNKYKLKMSLFSKIQI